MVSVRDVGCSLIPEWAESSYSPAKWCKKEAADENIGMKVADIYRFFSNFVANFQTLQIETS